MYWCTIEGCMNGYRQWNDERIDGGQTNECIERWYMHGSWIDWWWMDERKEVLERQWIEWKNKQNKMTGNTLLIHVHMCLVHDSSSSTNTHQICGLRTCFGLS